jgi:hypothetical protein
MVRNVFALSLMTLCYAAFQGICQTIVPLAMDHREFTKPTIGLMQAVPGITVIFIGAPLARLKYFLTVDADQQEALPDLVATRAILRNGSEVLEGAIARGGPISNAVQRSAEQGVVAESPVVSTDRRGQSLQWIGPRLAGIRKADWGNEQPAVTSRAI